MQTLTLQYKQKKPKKHDKHQLLGLYKQLFLNPVRTDRHSYRDTSGNWFSIPDPPDGKRIHQHLSGYSTIGVSIQQTASGWICFDVDNHNTGQAKADQQAGALIETIERETGGLPVVEQSTINGGYHIWLLLLNGRYPEFISKIKPFAANILKQADVACEVFAPGHKTGNMRLPFSADYTLINPYSGQQTGATGYDAVNLLDTFLKSGIYTHHYRIELDSDVQPTAPATEQPAQKPVEYNTSAQSIAKLYQAGLERPGQRIKALQLLYWYFTDYQGQAPASVKPLLERWIQTKHNGQSRDINANYRQGIRDSVEYIKGLSEKQARYKGSSFYYTSMSKHQLSADAQLLAGHLLDLVHYCATHQSAYLSAKGMKINRQYHVSIPYSKAVKQRMKGLSNRHRRRRAEQELMQRGLVQADRQTNIFLPAKKGKSPCNHLLVNVQMLYGYRTGQSVWTTYKNRLSSASVLSQIQALQSDYTQPELARICDVPERTFKRWLSQKRIPDKHLYKLLFLIS